MFGTPVSVFDAGISLEVEIGITGTLTSGTDGSSLIKL